jgi:hypothetical protein
MNQEFYARLISHVLSDVAERRTDSGAYLTRGHRRSTLINGDRRRVFVHGDHICYQNEQFHDSDSEYRLVMAFSAAEIIERVRLGRSWGCKTKASVHVAQALLASGCQRLKRRFLRSGQRRHTPPIGGTPVTPPEPAVLRLAETIRRQVGRYRTEQSNWRHDFNVLVASFRGSYCRDSEWLHETEERHLQWLSNFEKRQEFEWVEAMQIVAMARLYHEQRKHDQAATVYRKAILTARKARMNEEFRQVLLAWLRTSVKVSLRKANALADPNYFLPRTTLN